MKPQDNFPSNCASIFSTIIHKSSVCTLLAQTLYTFVKSSPKKFKVLRFSSAQVKIRQIPHVNFELTSQFLLKICIIFHCHTHNYPVSFKFIHFIQYIKGPNESPNFETFVCSGENLPNLSCHFPNQELVFLEILHHTLMSWSITPPYFFGSNIVCSGQKKSIKV